MKKATSPEPIRSEKNFWTVKDAARYLGVTDQAIYQWLKPNGNPKSSALPGPAPPTFRFGTRKAIRFPIKEFIAWVENFRQETN